METLSGPKPESIIIDFHGCSLERKVKTTPESISLEKWFRVINQEFTKEVKTLLMRWQDDDSLQYDTNDMKRVDIPNVYFNIY